MGDSITKIIEKCLKELRIDTPKRKDILKEVIEGARNIDEIKDSERLCKRLGINYKKRIREIEEDKGIIVLSSKKYGREYYKKNRIAEVEKELSEYGINGEERIKGIALDCLRGISKIEGGDEVEELCLTWCKYKGIINQNQIIGQDDKKEPPKDLIEKVNDDKNESYESLIEMIKVEVDKMPEKTEKEKEERKNFIVEELAINLGEHNIKSYRDIVNIKEYFVEYFGKSVNFGGILSKKAEIIHREICSGTLIPEKAYEKYIPFIELEGYDAESAISSGKRLIELKKK